MKQNLYSIYDNVACVFNKPFVEVNDASAKRAFQHALISSPDTRDYDLYYIGEFDDASGLIHVGDRAPLRVMTGLDVHNIRMASSDTPAVLTEQAV